MPALPAVQVLKTEVIGNMEGAGFANIFHTGGIGVTGPPTVAQLLTYLTALEASYKAHILPLLSIGITVTEVKCTDLSSSTGAVAEAGFADAGGVTSSGALAVSSAVVLSWAISRRYRGGHPRTYLPGIPANVTTNYKNLTGAAQTAFQAAGAAFLTACNAITIAGGSTELVCVHYYQNKEPFPGGPVFDPITACSVHSRLDSQRRRLGKETT